MGNCNMQLQRKIFVLYACVFVLHFSHFSSADQNEGGLILIPGQNNDDESSVITDEADLDEPFIPSNEWREIKPGQAVPAGLHIRINLQTGKKEAKLIDDEEMLDTRSKTVLTEEMKESIINLETENEEVNSIVSNAFKTIDEIKQELRSLQIDLKTDYEIMNELVTRLRNSSTSDNEKIFVFNELEYYLHQFDNAQDFIKMNGIELTLPALNSTNQKLKAVAAFTLGSAMQSNPKVQIAALESGLLPLLLRVIVQDNSPTVRSRCVFAVSCFIRNFPLAQQRFLEHGGLSALSTLFDPKQDSAIAKKLQVKVITLLSDLIEEEHSVSTKEAPDQAMRRQQYNMVQLKRSMVERGWCSLICRPLNAPEHDSREKVMEAMLWFVDPCRLEFAKEIPVLAGFYAQYTKLSAEEASSESSSSDTYFTNLKEIVKKLIFEINVVREEL